MGALMVSSEGSCAAYYNYEHRKALFAHQHRSPSVGRIQRMRCFPRSDFAIRRSKWRMEPEARPAAAWWKAFSRRCCWARPLNR